MKKLLVIASLITGCAAPGINVQNPDPKQVEEVRAIAKALSTQLGARLKTEIDINGEASAVVVCKKVAPQIASALSKQTGWRVGRVGTRVRNAESGTPDAWDASALATFSARMKQGERPDMMELAQVVTEPSGKTYLRYAKAVALAPMCAACHGSSDFIPDDVKRQLQAEYPNDKATGYSVGELRGAIVVTRPL